MDSQHCMRVVPREPPGSTTWYVQGVDPYGTSSYDPQGWRAILRSIEDTEAVVMEREGKTVLGQVVNKDRIVWDTGDTWSRLQLSYMQAHTLTTRPYVPLSLMILSGGKQVLYWMWEQIGSFRAFRGLWKQAVE